MTKAQKGELDVLFANTGTGAFAPLDQISEEHFDRQFDVNLKGLLFTVQKALPLLQPGGSTVLNASIVFVCREVSAPSSRSNPIAFQASHWHGMLPVSSLRGHQQFAPYSRGHICDVRSRRTLSSANWVYPTLTTVSVDWPGHSAPRDKGQPSLVSTRSSRRPSKLRALYTFLDS